MNPASENPLIGASGAVSGVIASYLVLHPHVRVLGLVLKAIPVRIPALWALGAWIMLQVFQAFAGLDASVGWWAHIAGFVTGLVLTPLLVRPGTPMLGRDISVIGEPCILIRSAMLQCVCAALTRRKADRYGPGHLSGHGRSHSSAACDRTPSSQLVKMP
jgi:hypothetical protein